LREVYTGWQNEFIGVMFWGWISHVWGYLWHLGLGEAFQVPPCRRPYVQPSLFPLGFTKSSSQAIMDSVLITDHYPLGGLPDICSLELKF